MRLFHHRLMNHLGVVKPEVESSWDYEGAIRALQEAAAAAAATNESSKQTSSSLNSSVDATVTSTQSEGSRQTVEAMLDGDQSCDHENPQSELTDLLNMPNLLLPEGVGDPESGASGPPAAVKAIWKFVSGSSTSETEGEKTQQRTSGQLALGGPENTKHQGSESFYVLIRNKIIAIMALANLSNLQSGKLHQLIMETVINWARSSIIEDVELIRQMFYLLYRQYGALDEVRGYFWECFEPKSIT